MKVEQKGKDFEPIVITLETEDEAKKMWLVLNTSMPDLKEAAQARRVRLHDSNMDAMWSAFNNVYSLRYGC